MKVQSLTLTLMLCALLITASGCAVLLAEAAGAGAGVGSYRYVEGNLNRDYMGPLPKVLRASLAALDDLNSAPNIEREDDSGGLIKGIMNDGTKVTVNLKKISDNQIEVGVRVGFFGDREQAELVQEKIELRFKDKYPSA
jgi:hypothetical protein